jgi:hypothetical protein
MVLLFFQTTTLLTESPSVSVPFISDDEISPLKSDQLSSCRHVAFAMLFDLVVAAGEKDNVEKNTATSEATDNYEVVFERPAQKEEERDGKRAASNTLSAEEFR